MSARAVACLALGIALAGCERSPGPERTENQAAMVVGSLLLTLETDKRTYRAGEPIALQLKLNNRSDRDTTLQFSSGQRYDFQIADASGGGETAWTWSADRSFIQALGTEQLAADGALEYAEPFTGRLAPGDYKVTGFITTSGSPLQASTTITVQ